MRRTLSGSAWRLAIYPRGLLRTFGLLVGKAGGKKFDQRVQELLVGEDDLLPPIEGLLFCWRRVSEQIGVLDQHLHAVGDPTLDDSARG